MKYLIIGSGIAGIRAAETIRALDPEGDITMIGGETFPPYCRPMIPMILGGHINPNEMVIREKDFYDSHRIEAVLGEWVEGMDVDKRAVYTDRKKSYPYDRLLIATGANPHDIGVAGCGLDRIFSLRTEVDAGSILNALPGAKQALILGCGPAGLKAAQELLHRGLSVTVLEKLTHPLPLIVDQRAGEMIAEQLQAMGIMVKTHCEVKSFEGNGAIRAAHLADGSEIPCDLVIVTAGVRPAADFVQREKVRVNRGILVDSHLETQTAGIFAAGDVAESMDVAFKEPRVNATWAVAAEQGAVAGMNMAGRRVSCNGIVGSNILRVGDMTILAGGRVNPPADGSFSIYTREDPRKGRYAKLIVQGDIPVGLVMVNQIDQGGVLLSMIRRGVPSPVKEDSLLKPSFNYSQLLLKV